MPKLSKKEKKAEKKALKEKEKALFELKLKQDRLDRELEGTRGQMSEVRRKVFEQAQLINLPIIKEEWLHKWGYFERTIDWKDFYISQLRDDIFYYELHHKLTEQKHNEHVDKLLNTYNDGVQKIMDMYEVERCKLLRDRERQETRLVLTQVRRNENMEAIMHQLLEQRKEEMEATTWENQRERQLKMFKFEESVMQLAQDGDEDVRELWAGMKSIFDKYKSATSKKRQEYLMMKQRDITEKNNLSQLTRRMTHLHGAAKQCRGRLSKIKLDEGIREELELRRASFEHMKQEMRICNEQDTKLLENLCLISNTVLQRLNRFLTKITDVISLLSVCKKLETQQEKVAPKLFTDEPLALFKNNIVMPMTDDMEQLWTKTMNVSKMKDHLAGELQKYQTENIRLQNRLKQVISKTLPC